MSDEQGTETVPAGKTAVVLDNGVTAFFGEKEKMQLEVAVNADYSTTITASFKNGKVVVKAIPALLATRSIAHGQTQKVRDSIAGDKTVDDAIASVEDVLESLAGGNWNQPREASTSGPKGNSIELIEAVAKTRKLDVEKVRAWLEARTPAEKTKLRNVPEVALEIAKARAAKAKKTEPALDAVNPFEGL